MNKVFEVKEFDTIINNSDYKEHGNYKYLNEMRFRQLEAFIHEFSGNDDKVDVLDFMRIGYKRNIGSTITIKNYVGLIQMKDGFQIQILPKIRFDNCDDENVKTKHIFLRMLCSMKDFPSKFFGNANLKIEKMNLYEIFINMYLQEVQYLVKKGIKSAYINQENNLRYYKGKLLVGKHIVTNLAHKERFYVNIDEFHLNRSENRLIKSTLLKLQKITNSAENSKNIKQLLMNFETVPCSKNYPKDFSKVVIDRNTKEYESLMDWSKVFLMNRSFSTFSGDTSTRALLFPMEKVYESYVAQQIKRIFTPDDWVVSIQNKEHYLFMHPKKQFALKPDIVLKIDARVVVLDTKWKNLINNEKSNYGISQSDMYQMYAYSKKYNTSEIWLLYPMNNEMKNMEAIKFDSGDGTIVNIFFIDIANIEESLLSLKQLLSLPIKNN